MGRRTCAFIYSVCLVVAECAVQEGVHIQDRGNVAMPVDMVKILKTQDENYVRTMRNSNTKVTCFAPGVRGRI